MKKKRSMTFVKSLCVVVIIAAIIISAVTVASNLSRRHAVCAERETYEALNDELAIEVNRLELLVSYSKTSGYAHDFARINLGYLFQNEVYLSDK